MPKFRKKPIEIDAFPYYGDVNALHNWLQGIGASFRDNFKGGYQVEGVGPYTLMCRTLEGDLNVSVGDWIIRGVNGEFYPCKPDIFDKTYEPA